MSTIPSIRIPERYNASLLLDGNLLAGRARKPAIVCGDTTVSYQDLFGQACRYGAALRELGAGVGERVLLVLDDGPAFPALFLGAMRVGAVPVPVNPFFHADEYRYFVEDSEARFVIVDAANAEAVQRGLGAAAARTRLLVVGGEAGDLPTIDEAATAQPLEVSPADTHRDEMAFWLYSSGSTGHPKAVVHLHHDILYTCETYARNVLRIEEFDVTFSTTKLFHAYGLGNNLSFPYWAGASTVLLAGRPTPAAIFDAARRYVPTLFFSVPTLYNAMLNTDGDRDAFASTRHCVSAAEPLPAEVWHRWHERHGLVILDGIGSTEMLHIYCSNTLDDVEPGSSGRAVPGYEIKLLDDDGAQIEDAGTGELWVRGDSALDRYWNQPERTEDCLQDGWFRSRDRYRRDIDGRYWYEGRGDDMFKVSGLWVSPAEIEGVLIEHPAVAECAVVGAAVNGFLKPKAVVVPREPAAPGQALEQALRTHCDGRVHRYQLPQLYTFVDELPKTVTGKIQRFKLRD